MILFLKNLEGPQRHRVFGVLFVVVEFFLDSVSHVALLALYSE